MERKRAARESLAARSFVLLPRQPERPTLLGSDSRRLGKTNGDRSALVDAALVVACRHCDGGTSGGTGRGADDRALRVLAQHLAGDRADHGTADDLRRVILARGAADLVDLGRGD